VPAPQFNIADEQIMEQGHVDYGVYEDQHGRQRNIQEPIYEPFDSKEELQVANWIIQENITRSAIDRLAKIGIYNKDGKQIVFASKNRTKKVEQIREIYPELGKDKYETIAFGKISYCAKFGYRSTKRELRNRIYFRPKGLSLEQKL